MKIVLAAFVFLAVFSININITNADISGAVADPFGMAVYLIGDTVYGAFSLIDKNKEDDEKLCIVNDHETRDEMARAMRTYTNCRFSEDRTINVLGIKTKAGKWYCTKKPLHCNSLDKGAGAAASCFPEDWKNRDKYALAKKTYINGRFSYEKDGKRFYCTNQPAAIRERDPESFGDKCYGDCKKEMKKDGRQEGKCSECGTGMMCCRADQIKDKSSSQCSGQGWKKDHRCTTKRQFGNFP